MSNAGEGAGTNGHKIRNRTILNGDITKRLGGGKSWFSQVDGGGTYPLLLGHPASRR